MISQYFKEELFFFDFIIIKDFLRFYVDINRERINDERIIIDSINTFTK